MPHGSVVRPATNAPEPSRTAAVPSDRAVIVRPSGAATSTSPGTVARAEPSGSTVTTRPGTETESVTVPELIGVPVARIAAGSVGSTVGVGVADGDGGGEGSAASGLQPTSTRASSAATRAARVLTLRNVPARPPARRTPRV